MNFSSEGQNVTRAEFSIVLAFLAKGVGVKNTDAGQAEVYFDLLGDLPAPAVEEAARRALLEHKYPSLPPVGLIRQHAIAVGKERTTGPEAWRLILAAVRRYGAAGESRGLATLPADVAHGVRCFGWRVICDATDNELGIVQTQFLKVYSTLESSYDRKALMPPMGRACAALVGGIGHAIEEKPMPRLAAGGT